MFRIVPGFAALALLAQPLAAQVEPPSPERQIEAAVAPLPGEFRAAATVLGYRPDAMGLVQLRQGDGPFICLADSPGDERYHVACYHRSLEPFMERGRALRAAGRTEDVDSIRYAEIRAGTLPMPTTPAALYSLTAPADSVDRESGEVKGAQPLYVVYIPFATAESTGLPTTPAKNTPWLMFPGAPNAHIMFVPDM
ncbi:MAG TPA: hypothetical protein VK936_02635 [Longimicrobiales bacterium]|nr:hypothetical protein [Longimicrobiales bacterium]